MPRRPRSSARFLVVMVVLLATAAGTTAYLASSSPPAKPDLRRVVLTPAPGSRVADLPARLKDAVVLLRLRLAAVDHSRRSTVAVEGNRLVVRTPPAVAEQVRRLGSPGLLEMRPVLREARAVRCPVVLGVTLGDPTRPLRACSQDGNTTYQLGPARLVGSSVRGARGVDSPARVQIEFTSEGQRLFSELTGALLGRQAPTNELAIVLDGVVITAPSIVTVITGDAQITGSFTLREAEALAATIRYGGLPIAFAISEG